MIGSNHIHQPNHIHQQSTRFPVVNISISQNMRDQTTSWLAMALRFVLLLCYSVSAFHVTQTRNWSRFKSSDDAVKSSSRMNMSSSITEFRFGINQQSRDIVIVGGALAGLSTALYLSQMDPSRHITILDREEYGNPSTKEKSKHAQPSSFAAAGMLAPLSERLPPGPLLDLCMSSRRMYTEFCDIVESLAQESGEEGSKYLFDSEFPNARSNSELDPWCVGYVGSGGFLAPAFAGDTVATWAPPEKGGAVWLDSTQVRELEPRLHRDVVGGWWFPDDASVDARRLTCSLRAACVAAGVQILSGPHNEVTSLDLENGTCRGVYLRRNKSSGGKRFMRAKQVLIANGAWMRELLPIPVEPHKGQSLSLRMPDDASPFLRRVLFAQDSYIVPKADGRVVVGATVEAGSFDPNVTPMGLMHILSHAIELVPDLKDLPVEETWVGLRPTTPDKGPILGKTPWDNVFVAGGYWRNGVLLAPKTGQLVASLMLSVAGGDEVQLNSNDAAFLEAFAWDRFTSRDRSPALAANSRYSSSVHPIQRRGRSSVASGTELGSQSTARAAVDDRKKDRISMLGASDSDEAFERAAALGRNDIAAYQLETSAVNGDTSPATITEEVTPQSYDLEGAADALTVGVAEPVEDKRKEVSKGGGEENLPSSEVQATYEKIQENLSKRHVVLPDDIVKQEDRPDPGFRIHHVNKDTGEEREVPPYTSPQEFLDMIAAEKQNNKSVQPDDLVPEESTETNGATTPHTDQVAPASDSMFDGYQDIESANSRGNRDDELEAMRAARVRNRLADDIDHSKIGSYGLADEQDNKVGS